MVGCTDELKLASETSLTVVPETVTTVHSPVVALNPVHKTTPPSETA